MTLCGFDLPLSMRLAALIHLTMQLLQLLRLESWIDIEEAMGLVDAGCRILAHVKDWHIRKHNWVLLQRKEQQWTEKDDAFESNRHIAADIG